MSCLLVGCAEDEGSSEADDPSPTASNDDDDDGASDTESTETSGEPSDAQGSILDACQGSCDAQEQAGDCYDEELCVGLCAVFEDGTLADCIEIGVSYFDCLAAQTWTCDDDFGPQPDDLTACESLQLAYDECMQGGER
ncbi:MAG: hypothetical protein B7733_15770 [Myxococcales bacterium FL481]|nr:MAG: hypothetical protein B7733_15770 [Myxococcales bacterium FL481]